MGIRIPNEMEFISDAKKMNPKAAPRRLGASPISVVVTMP
jgi:hypothetical protein